MASSSTNSSQPYTQTRVPIFNGEMYEFWSIRMLTLFDSQDLLDIVEQGIQPIEKAKDSSGKDKQPESAALKVRKKE